VPRYRVDVEQTLDYIIFVTADSPTEAREQAEDRVRYGQEGVMFDSYDSEVREGATADYLTHKEPNETE
jgi:hypothetical protein